MSFNEEMAQKNGAEKLEISDNRRAWVLPEIENGRKMIAYVRGSEMVWVHPNYKDEQNSKKKK